MKVAVIGAAGRVGQLLCLALKNADGFEPVALVRKEEQVKLFEEQQIEAHLTDIENSSVDEIGASLEGCEAVVWTAGCGGPDLARVLTVDLDGAIKAIEACQKYSISRFIMVSAVNAEDRSFWWHTALKNYYIAKRTTDCVLRGSGLEYTIVQPGSLLSEQGTGKLCASDSIQTKKANHYSIQREDVANFIVGALKNPTKTVNKTIPLANGNLSITEFLESL